MKIYFNIMDYFFGWRIPKLKYLLTLLYFPFLIIICICNLSMYKDSQPTVLWLTILIYSIFAPTLMIPSYFFLKNRNLFILLKTVKYLDDSNLNFINKPSFFVQSFEIRFQEVKKNLENVYEFITNTTNCQHNGTNYKPNKKIIKSTRERVKKFYDNEARNYFDILECDFNKFLEIISQESILTEENKIHLYEELKNDEIAKMISQLNNITNIHKSRIALLFNKLNKKTGIYEPLKWNSIKSSESQRIKLFKS